MRRALRGLRPGLSYANVTATFALVIALGGAGAFAAGQLPLRSVGPPSCAPARSPPASCERTR